MFFPENGELSGELMSKSPGLVIKGGAYYSRRGVTKDLRPAIQNKTEVWITLHASDRWQTSEAATDAPRDRRRRVRFLAAEDLCNPERHAASPDVADLAAALGSSVFLMALQHLSRQQRCTAP
jgi:hypothetical protein